MYLFIACTYLNSSQVKLILNVCKTFYTNVKGPENKKYNFRKISYKNILLFCIYPAVLCKDSFELIKLQICVYLQFSKVMTDNYIMCY